MLMLPQPRRAAGRRGRQATGDVLSRSVGFFIVAGAAAALPAIAAAQSAGDLSIDIQGRAVYDSNQLRIPDSETVPAGRQRDDIRYSPSISLGYSRPIGRQRVFLSGLVGRDFYQNNSNLDRQRLQFSGGVNYTLGARCSGAIDASYSERQNGLNGFGDRFVDDPTVPDPEVIPEPIDPIVDDDVGRLVDNGQEALSYGASFGCGSASGRLSFGANARRSTLRNTAETRRFSNSNNTTYSGYVGVSAFGPGQLQVTGSYSTIDYPGRTLGLGPGIPVFLGATSTESYQIGLNYARPIGTRLSGSIGASYLTSRPEGLGAPYNAPAYNVSLTYRPGTRLTTTLSAARSIQSSNSVGALFTVLDRVQLGTSYQLGSSLSARAQASYERRNFRQSFALPGDGLTARSRENTTTFGAGIGYSPRSLYDVGFDIRQRLRRSTPTFFNYDSTTATVSVGIHF